MSPTNRRTHRSSLLTRSHPPRVGDDRNLQNMYRSLSKSKMFSSFGTHQPFSPSPEMTTKDGSQFLGGSFSEKIRLSALQNAKRGTTDALGEAPSSSDALSPSTDAFRPSSAASGASGKSFLIEDRVGMYEFAKS